MRQQRISQIATVGIGVVIGIALGSALGSAAAQQDGAEPPKAQTQQEIVQAVLQKFAEAVAANDVEKAMALLPTEEELTKLIGPEAGPKSANELRSHLKMNFHEFTDALKAFGKCDLVEVNPGKVRRVLKGESGMLTDTYTAENGYLSFARDGNYFIDLRMNVGAVIRISRERWVLTNMVTRLDRFPSPGSGG